MERDFEKGHLRKVSADQWLEIVKKRAEEKNFEPWIDLISEEDYHRSLKQYLGNLESLKDEKYLNVGAGFGSGLHYLLEVGSTGYQC